MKAQILQHVAFEGPGSITAWLEQAGYVATPIRFFAGDTLPDRPGTDLLVVMGGPMSVHDTKQYPWLLAEKAYIRAAIHAGLPVLGICLGAQLIASALDAPVFPNPVREIGWFPVRGAAVPSGVYAFPGEVEVLHWHGETYELPRGAIRLASSEGCVNQAFQYGRRVMGLQFHLEVTPESLDSMIGHCRADLVPGPFVQSAESLLAASPGRYVRINGMMGQVLDSLTAP